MAVALGAIAGLGASAIKYEAAQSKDKEAQQELFALQKPFYKVQDEYYQNRNTAGSVAESGLPSATKQYETTEGQRGLSAGISGVLGAGGSPNDIAGLFDTYSRSVDRTGAEDADAHLKNIQYYMDQNSTIGAEKSKQWAINEYQPYENKLKEITERRGAAEQNENNAINEGVGSVSSALTAYSNKELLKSLNKPATPAATDPFTANRQAVGTGGGNYVVPPALLQPLPPSSIASRQPLTDTNAVPFQAAQNAAPDYTPQFSNYLDQ